jgi:hypothetical protein
MKQLAHLSLVYITHESLANLLYEHPEAIAQTPHDRYYSVNSWLRKPAYSSYDEGLFMKGTR